MDSTLGTPNWIESGLPALSAIVPMPAAGDQPRFEFPELSRPFEASPAGTSPKAIWPECDCTETARACADLAEGICWRLPPNRPTILGFTSPGDGDGKTGLLLSLAPELAKLVKGGVLVVDADFRKADLTARLAIPAERTPPDSTPIWPTDVPRLSVLPAVRQEAGWIEDLQDDWPLVLVDMDSLEHVEAADLLKRCDGVCLVVRLGHTARRAVAEAVRVVRDSGRELLGCVVVE
jgi:Mrp family chromosome partitioning ATPase